MVGVIMTCADCHPAFRKNIQKGIETGTGTGTGIIDQIIMTLQPLAGADH
jgi:hypothetical protein